MGELVDEREEGVKEFSKENASPFHQATIEVIAQFEQDGKDVVHFGKPSVECFGVLFKGTPEMVKQVREFVEELQKDCG